jgi:hypothetical protein
MMSDNAAYPSPKELARTKLGKGSALRIIQLDENSRCCEIYTYGGWKQMDEDWAREALLTYGQKARKFIQKHMPELLKQKNDRKLPIDRL